MLLRIKCFFGAILRCTAILLFSALSSCDNVEDSIPFDQQGPESVPRIPLSPVTSLGIAEGDPNYVFSNVTSAAFLHDGSVVIASGMDHQLKQYSENGAFIRKMGREGGGPGEFRALREVFGLPDGRIMAWDAELARATYFLPSGGLERTVSPDLRGLREVRPSLVGAFSDGRLVFRDAPSVRGRRGEVSRIRRDTLDFVVFEEKGRDWGKITSVEGPEFLFYNDGDAWGNESLIFGRELLARVSADRLILAHTDSLAILVFDERGARVEVHGMHRPRAEATDALVVQERARRIEEKEKELLARSRLLVVGGGPNLMALAEERLSSLRAYEILPALADFLCIGDSAYLFREFLPSGGATQRWIWTDRDLSPVGWFELEGKDVLLSASDNRLLVLRRDSLDIESVLIMEASVKDGGGSGS